MISPQKLLPSKLGIHIWLKEYRTNIQGWASDKTELEVLEHCLKESNISNSAVIEYEQWRGSTWNKCPEQEQIDHVLHKEISAWGQKGLDDVSELLVCLLILFSQDQGGQFSKKIGQLHDCLRYVMSALSGQNNEYKCFRFVLWSYIDSQNFLWNTKEELFNGAFRMAEITKKILRIEENFLINVE